nr:hypothetical protein B0A51_17700 [Rachicladosporium sp. CCFEE 5018]
MDTSASASNVSPGTATVDSTNPRSNGSSTGEYVNSSGLALPHSVPVAGLNGVLPVLGPSRPTVDANGRALNPRSCVTCRKRKVKCDKTHPCANCNRAHIECIYPAPGRAPRRPRKAGEGSGRDKELLERLRRLEGVVKGLGVEVPGDGVADKDDEANGEDGDESMGEELQDAPAVSAVLERPLAKGQPRKLSSQGTPSEGLDPREDIAPAPGWIDAPAGGFETRFGRLVVNEGRSRYINSSFWANLSNEVEDLKGILNHSDDSDFEDGDSPSAGNQLPSHAQQNHNGFIFGFSSQNVDMLSLHPLPSYVPLYWQTYKENVDPLVKVLHIPTIEPTILRAASHLAQLSKGFEVLLFTVYYAAVTSLSLKHCYERFNEDKGVLLTRYRFAIEQALARANFLTTEEVIVLQAFVVFLICLRRNNDARVIWTLTGLVVRIAQTIGIHRDGMHFGLKPFEIEMRRRLWWQVCILDTRASEDHGCDPTITEQSFDTKMPLNVNDVDITPDMAELPAEKLGCTDMTFCLIRFEVANTFRRINYVPPGPPRACQEMFQGVTLEEKEKWITDCHNRLEDRYLAHCDMNVPLYWVTATVARLMMSKMWLMVYHPFQRQDGGASLSAETKEKLFITSLENIEYSLLLETESRTMKWGWLFKTYMQWHALAFILSELCHRTTGDLVERAWVAVEKTRDGRWGEYIADDNAAGHLWRPLKKLYRKARDARSRGLQEETLAEQRNDGTKLVRHYSPNGNPMFGHPRTPTPVRAPLSRAQLHRFTSGPVFGERPLDSHELLKSPKFTQQDGQPVDTVDLNGSTAQTKTSTSRRKSSNALPATSRSQPQPAAYPSKITKDAVHPPQQPLPILQAIDLTPPGPPAQSFPTTYTQPSSGPNTLLPPYDPTFDPLMDTSGDLNWESWDQLVSQWGMDVDSGPPDINPPLWNEGQDMNGQDWMSNTWIVTDVGAGVWPANGHVNGV